MDSQSRFFRENPHRAIWVQGTINQALVDKLAPEIARLRFESSEPITVYIDSDGGDVAAGRAILSLLKTPSVDGNVCRIITVAYGHAKSAAANLLSSGNYAISYPAAQLMYHGISTTKPTVNLQTARELARILKSFNENSAMQLVDGSLERIFFQFMMRRAEQGGSSNLDTFVSSFHGQVSLDVNNALRRAYDRVQKYLELDRVVFDKLPAHDPAKPRRKAETQAAMLGSIIDYELVAHPEVDYDLYADQDSLFDDYLLLFEQEGQDARNNRIASWRAFLLSPADAKVHDSLPDAAKEDWLKEKTESILRAFVHMFISFCRELQKGDFDITPDEAHMFGLVDEVVGSSKVCLRSLVEKHAAATQEPKTNHDDQTRLTE